MIIRFVLVVCTILVTMPVALIATVGADLSKPFPKWRRNILLVIRPLVKLVVVLMGVLVNVCGWENYQDALRNDLVRCFQFHPFYLLVETVSRSPCQTIFVSLMVKSMTFWRNYVFW